MYGSEYSIFKQYSGGECPGKFVALTGEAATNDAGWYSYGTDEWPIAGAFDGVDGQTNGVSGYQTARTVAGTGAGSDDAVHIILQAPCSFYLHSFGLTARADGDPSETPSKMTVHGGTDSWSFEEIGDFSSVTSWTAGETKNFTTNSTMGPYKIFRFTVERVASVADAVATVGDIQLFAQSIHDPCGIGSHSCSANAECTNTASSYYCLCNTGFIGNGATCTALDLIPPSDVGKGDSWTKDSTVEYNSKNYTMYADYGGAVCPGRFRVKTDWDWSPADNSAANFEGDEWPPSGAFDRVAADTNQKSGYMTVQNVSGTDAGADTSTLELILQSPCWMHLQSYSVQARQSGGSLQSTPSKAELFGSTDGSSWTSLGTYEKEIHWGAGETRGFTADADKGPFVFFKLGIKRVASAEDTVGQLGDLALYGYNWTGTDCDASKDAEPNAEGNWTRLTSPSGSLLDTVPFYYTCKNGFTLGLSGTENTTTNFTCSVLGVNNQTWQLSGGNSMPTCHVSSCNETDPEPNNLSTAVKVVATATGNPGDNGTFTYSCNDGYVLTNATAGQVNANIEFTCTANGYDNSTWQSPAGITRVLPTCELVNCTGEAIDPEPNNLTAQVLRTDNGSQVGVTLETAVFRYSCNDGYELSDVRHTQSYSDITFTCTADAYNSSKWSQAIVPWCTAVYCDSVSDPQPNALNPQLVRNNTVNGTTLDVQSLEYRCNLGYKMDEYPPPQESVWFQFNCTPNAYANSTWQNASVSLPTCSHVSCDEATDPLPNTLPAQTVRLNFGQTGNTTDLANFTYTCNDGYKLEFVPLPTNTTDVVFNCTGVRNLVAEWAGTPPNCPPVECSWNTDPEPTSLPAQVYIRNRPLGNTTENATFVYSCNDGFQLTGISDTNVENSTTEFTCSANSYGNSTWKKINQTEPYPTCFAVSCNEANDPEPNNPLIGSQTIRVDLSPPTGVTFETDTFNYSCNAGYKLDGVAWPGDHFKEVVWNCTGNSYANSTWQQASVPTCSPVPCMEGIEFPPNNLTHSENYQVIRADPSAPVGVTTNVTKFRYSCNNGFKLVGVSLPTTYEEHDFTCSADSYGNSSWKGLIPSSCAAVNCSEANDPFPNALTAEVIRVELSPPTGQTFETDTFNYSCNAGYKLDGVAWPGDHFKEVVWNCTGNSYANSTWQQASVPTCSPVPCMEGVDPLPNILQWQVIRADPSPPVGNTTDTVSFRYSCNAGYKLDCVALPTDYEDVTYTCTADTYGNSSWQGLTRSCSDVQCDAVNDPQPNDLTTGVYRVNAPFGNTTDEKTFVYSCIDGYVLTSATGGQVNSTVNFTCTANSYGNSTWQTSDPLPTCTLSYCDAENDPEPNALNPFLIRNTTGNGTTGDVISLEFRCEWGYEMDQYPPPQESVWFQFNCTPNGYADSTWQNASVSLPTCSPVLCDEANDPEPNTLNTPQLIRYPGDTPPGNTTQVQQFKYTCNDGYQLTGVAWPGDDHENTTFTCTANSYANSTWQTTDPVPYSTCYAVNCSEANDPEPNDPLTGTQVIRVDLSPPTGVTLDVATFNYSCNAGYKLDGIAWPGNHFEEVIWNCTAVSYANSTWQQNNIPFPTCSPVPCMEGIDVEPNNLTYQVIRQDPAPPAGVTTNNTNFRYSCNNGFKLDGVALPATYEDVSFNCGADVYGNSSWKGTPSTCSAVSCDEANDPEPNDRLAGTQVIRVDLSPPTGVTFDLATFNYSCNAGYKLDGIAWPGDHFEEVVWNCTPNSYANSTWQQNNIPFPTCSPVPCMEGIDTQPNTLTYQVIRQDPSPPTGVTTNDTNFRYSCNNGFKLDGVALPATYEDVSFNCGADVYGNSSWKGTPSTCSAVSCDEANDPEPNDRLAGTQVIRVDLSPPTGVTFDLATFNYSCNAGYKLDGIAWPGDHFEEVVWNCTPNSYANSTWQQNNIPFPTCSPVPCMEGIDSQPNTLTYQVIRQDPTPPTGVTTNSSNFRFSCNDGFILDGVALPATYEDISFSCTGDTYGNSTWKGTPSTCSAVYCNETTDPEPNALTAEVIRVDLATPVGVTFDIVTFNYSCNAGYKLDGVAWPGDHFKEVAWNCTGNHYANSTFQQEAVPTCSAVPCMEGVDPEPNNTTDVVDSRDFNRAQLLRIDPTPPVGTTTQDAQFRYSCKPGYTLDNTTFGTLFLDVWFNCTADTYGNSSWKGTPPTCSPVPCNGFNDTAPNNVTAQVIRTDLDGLGPPFGRTLDTGNFEYSCNAGYKLDGVAWPGSNVTTSVFTCTAQPDGNSSWIGTPPTCSGEAACMETVVRETGKKQPEARMHAWRRSSGRRAKSRPACMHGDGEMGRQGDEEKGGRKAAVPCMEGIDLEPNTLPNEVVRADPSPPVGNTTTLANFTYTCNNGFQLDLVPNSAIHTVEMEFNCSGDSYGNSSWKGSPPTCFAVSCDEATDPEPNVLNSQLIRRSRPLGVTHETNVFREIIPILIAYRYSCNNGYKIVGEAWPGNDFIDKDFNCTGNAYANATWKGTTPYCESEWEILLLLVFAKTNHFSLWES
uniref:Uncharacterized protein n=1 Tax=Chromera velia CCMP2878 TaxID=1169474 RepID=A0A0G4I192_9ALVE|eukprot:Cvel_17.t1-p1 / transcript=Cvel_17.t1 / gene=Cvel_17 / organism=Chromera_velia_CCMP2878 / gene_product=Sushi, von Willebrand factor type A, EGF and, putative / transcript_product=Sushi, von Willebrand factor type A, EGF and, putative / location=Cvel_scaffold5:107116-124704(+) / protein_length=2524 / sequence_SO=supercontig / SO=protein_coding / is_pseudo=false